MHTDGHRLIPGSESSGSGSNPGSLRNPWIEIEQEEN